MDEEMKCETCVFFVSEEGRTTGKCHRYAPGRTDEVWPYVFRDDFCGEYLSKDSPDDIYILRDGIYGEPPEM